MKAKRLSPPPRLPARPMRSCAAPLLVGILALGAPAPGAALDFKASGRVTFGAGWRTEAPDPNLLNGLNAAAGQAGIAGLASGSANSDDGNTNFHQYDAISTVLKGYLDVGATHGTLRALVRVKAWRDFALADRPRAWGNIPNDYAAGEPLSDHGAPRLSRFSGVAVADAYLEDRFEIGAMRLFGRIGQQSIPWGERSGFAGGLDALNPRDFPALRRAGAVPQETRVAVPALFARLDPGLPPGVGVEGFYQARFRPSALDMCGTFWAITDYAVAGCDKVMAGPPAQSDRARVQSGAYLKRLATPEPSGRQYGLALTWKARATGTDFGLYHAHYTARTATPGLRKSTRVGPPVIPGDPDGRNVRFFTEYVDDIDLYSLTFVHKRGHTTLSGELSYRPNQPLQLPASDATGALLSASAPTLLRADANALAPGALFHGYDRHRTGHFQLGLQHDWSGSGGAYSGSAELVAKQVFGLPDPSVRRYLRPDQFGAGPVGGVCTVSTGAPAKQCSLSGYVSAEAYAVRLRFDARYQSLLPGLDGSASVVLVRDIKGWAYDALVFEGRMSMNLALRLEYRKRYLLEMVYAPVWGGDYNAAADRDQVSVAAGVRF